jgi:hypothetical protein
LSSSAFPTSSSSLFKYATKHEMSFGGYSSVSTVYKVSLQTHLKSAFDSVKKLMITQANASGRKLLNNSR